MLNFRNSKNLIDADYCKYIAETKYVRVEYWPERFVVLDNTPNDNVYSINDYSDKTVLIHFNSQFYHFLTDNLSVIIREHKENKNVRFIITIDKMQYLEHYSYTRFLEIFLKHRNINYTIVDLEKFYAIKINNFYYYNLANSQTMDDIYINFQEYFKDFIINKDRIPNKKVYLSRTKVPRHEHQVLFGNDDPNIFMFQDDERVDDESKLEQFMKQQGFEIVTPEDFPDFIQQLNFMYEVKTLVSLTGSGLMNLLFMQDKQTVIDLTTPLVAVSRLTLHPFYYYNSYAANQIYVSIPHHRNVDDITDKLSKYLHSEI